MKTNHITNQEQGTSRSTDGPSVLANWTWRKIVEELCGHGNLGNGKYWTIAGTVVRQIDSPDENVIAIP